MKLLVVEDETIIRNGIVRHLPWKQLEITEVRTAANAVEALDLFASYRPQIVLTDIRMPGMDGIEMCRKMRESYPDFQIIFLSGYVEKDYLMSAIDLRAVDYVEKPLDLQKLTAAVRLAVDCVKKDEVRREALLHRILMDGAEARRHLGSLEGGACVYLVHMQKEEDAAKLRKCLEETDLLQRGGRTVRMCDFVSPRIVALLLGRQEDKTPPDVTARELVGFLREEEWSGGWFAAKGKLAETPEEVPDSWHTAEASLGCLSYMGWSHFARFPEQPAEYRVQSADGAWMEEFAGFVEAGKLKEAMDWLDGFVRRMTDERAAMSWPVYHMGYTLRQMIWQKDYHFHNVDGEDGREAREEAAVDRAETLADLGAMLKKELRRRFAANRAEEKGNQKTGFLIQKVIDCMRENYQDPTLSIKSLSDAVYLTPTYLSNLFKRHTGVTIGQYLTDLRIGEAKKKLKDPQYKLYQIAELVGYNDPNYFARIFKKKTGCTPSEYRERGNG